MRPKVEYCHMGPPYSEGHQQTRDGTESWSQICHKHPSPSPLRSSWVHLCHHSKSWMEVSERTEKKQPTLLPFQDCQWPRWCSSLLPTCATLPATPKRKPAPVPAHPSRGWGLQVLIPPSHYCRLEQSQHLRRRSRFPGISEVPPGLIQMPYYF